MLPEEFGQAKAQGEGGGKDQPGIGHQAVVVEGDLDAVRGGYVVASIGCSFSGVGFCYKTIIPDSEAHLFVSFSRPPTRRPSVD